MSFVQARGVGDHVEEDARAQLGAFRQGFDHDRQAAACHSGGAQAGGSCARESGDDEHAFPFPTPRQSCRAVKILAIPVGNGVDTVLVKSSSPKVRIIPVVPGRHT